jgi:hypothetical protein
MMFIERDLVMRVLLESLGWVMVLLPVVGLFDCWERDMSPWELSDSRHFLFPLAIVHENLLLHRSRDTACNILVLQLP